MKIPVLLRAESTLHDRPRSQLKLKIKQRFFKMLRERVSGVLSIGGENTAYWRHYLGEQLPIFDCCYAVDNKFFQTACAEASRTREEFRRSLGLEPGRPIILFAGKLVPRKRCDDLLEAFLQTCSEGGFQSLPYLLIVGDGENRAELEMRAAQAPAGSVRFLGFQNQSELPRFYDLCNVFVLPSVDEPWGLAINEVMNAGRAVIVSDEVGCQQELVHPGRNGCVVKAGDVAGLADALRQVLSGEPTWTSMGAESARIIEGYSFDQNVHGIRLALQSLVPGFATSPVLQAG